MAAIEIKGATERYRDGTMAAGVSWRGRAGVRP
jgi:hypothetical protein